MHVHIGDSYLLAYDFRCTFIRYLIDNANDIRLEMGLTPHDTLRRKPPQVEEEKLTKWGTQWQPNKSTLEVEVIESLLPTLQQLDGGAFLATATHPTIAMCMHPRWSHTPRHMHEPATSDILKSRLLSGATRRR